MRVAGGEEKHGGDGRRRMATVMVSSCGVLALAAKVRKVWYRVRQAGNLPWETGTGPGWRLGGLHRAWKAAQAQAEGPRNCCGLLRGTDLQVEFQRSGPPDGTKELHRLPLLLISEDEELDVAKRIMLVMCLCCLAPYHLRRSGNDVVSRLVDRKRRWVAQEVDGLMLAGR